MLLEVHHDPRPLQLDSKQYRILPKCRHQRSGSREPRRQSGHALQVRRDTLLPRHNSDACSLLFAGLLMNYDKVPRAFKWMLTSSFFHAAYEALLVNELRYLQLIEHKVCLNHSRSPCGRDADINLVRPRYPSSFSYQYVPAIPLPNFARPNDLY